MGNNKIHILVVDDDNRIRDLLKEYLTNIKKYESPYNSTNCKRRSRK